MIGKTLVEILQEKNMTVSELGRKANISNQTLYSIIKRDNMKIDFAYLIRICEVLNVNVERFYKDYLEGQNTKAIKDTSRQELLSKYDKLNDIGKEKALCYIDDLLINDKYTKKTVEMPREEYYQVAAYGGELSECSQPPIEELTT
ncbi:MAG: helix-turn-helix transcriptional regulator [Clostridia bacterium]|nr:helix-turn-helix transcriptional regulator [Clostridia bacterium]